uniref:Lipase domain-containing protein n=1 Tax=Phlebotomus papatasi TaxID=29031 RepID=A0A1B0D398_PHLPP
MNILEMILNSNLREKVKFFLYKRKYKSRRELMQFPRTTKTNDELQDGINYYFGDFNPELETKLLIHGWHSNEESDTVQNIKNNYLSRKNLNIVTVDYRDIAANDFYYYPAFQIREVGKYIAELIDYLVVSTDWSPFNQTYFLVFI